MRIFVVAALTLMAAGPVFAQAEDTRPELQRRLIADAAAHGYGTEGSQFGLDMGVPEGKSVRYAFNLTAGETYYVNGGCDANCTSIALMMTDANSSGVAYTEDGNIVAHTPFDGTVHPSFTLTAKKTTTYSIVINVDQCHGPARTCVAGAAVFRAGRSADAGWLKTKDFTIDPEGTIVVSDAFSDETFCVMDTIDNTTAEAAATALAKGEWPADIDAAFKTTAATCGTRYNWTEAERGLAVIVSTTQVLLNRTLDDIAYTGVDYDAVVAIQTSLTKAQNAKFMDGTWFQDAVLVAKLEAGLREHGMGDDASAMAEGKTAVGAFANQVTTMRQWVDLRTPR